VVQYLENQMAVALGGRIAEELIFGEDDITTGAGGDFQQVTRTARMMVEQMGFSRTLGQVAWGGGQGGPSFLGASAGRGSDFSQATADMIDQEVRLIACVPGPLCPGISCHMALLMRLCDTLSLLLDPRRVGLRSHRFVGLQVKALVERAYRRAKDLVQSNIQVLHDVAAVLMEKENIDGDEFSKIILASQAKQYLKDDAPGITIPYQA
jgi:cell division protease FtsH